MLSLFHWRAINHKLHAGTLAVLALLLCVCGAVKAQTARVALPDNRQALAGLLSSAKFLGHQSPVTPVKVGFVLPLRNQDALTQVIHDLYDPHSTSYHQFLTPQQFDNAFGPSADDYNAVIAYARAEGFTVTHTFASRDLLVVTGSTQTVENAFNVHMNRYLMASGHVGFCNDVPPSAPQDIAGKIVGITGLNSLVPMHHHMQFLKNVDKAMRPIGLGGHIGGNGPAGGLAPADVKSIYKLSSVPYSGAGESIALFENDGFNYSDVAKFALNYGIPAPNVVPILVGNFNGRVESLNGETEDVLDIDMALSLAPSATVYVYESDGQLDTAVDYDAEYHQIAEDDRAQVVSTSIGAPETAVASSDLQSEGAAFKQMAAEGQSMFAASGDSGAYDNAELDPTAPTIGVDDPASQAEVTGVGGTTLTTTGSTTLGYDYEVVWQGLSIAAAAQGKGGSGGGVSTITPEPDYQTTASISATSSTIPTTSTTGTTAATSTTSTTGGPPGGVEASPRAIPSSSSSSSSSTSSSSGVCTVPSTAVKGTVSTFRQVPDVALDADPNTGYDVYVADQGGWNTIAGTSAAAPLWAGFTSLVNENEAAQNQHSVGFLNPSIYKIGASSSAYAANFNDITCGNNLYYYASPGYDDCTGWGSFIGGALLQTLSNMAQTDQGTITGLVTDSTGMALQGATITVRVASSNYLLGQTKSDVNGSYSLPVLLGGTYLISVDDTAAVGSTYYAGESVTVQMPTTIQSLTVNLVLTPSYTYSAGLQMISAPSEFGGVADFSTLFGVADDPPIGPPYGSDPILYYWNSSILSYSITPTSPADTLHLGYGYWVDFPTLNYLHRQGAPAPAGQPFRIDLQTGWNMIGDPFTVPIALSTLQVDTVNPGTPVPITTGANTIVALPLYTYGTTDSGYERVTSSGVAECSSSSTSTPVSQLCPLSGYWVYAYSPAAIVVPAPGGSGAPPPPGI